MNALIRDQNLIVILYPEFNFFPGMALDLNFILLRFVVYKSLHFDMYPSIHPFLHANTVNYRSGGKEVDKRKETGREEVKEERKQRKEESLHLQFSENSQ